MRRIERRIVCTLAVGLGLGGTAAFAEEPPAGPAPTRVEFDAMKQRLDALEKKQQEAETAGPHLPHLHGYGDVHYNHPETGTLDVRKPAQADFHRLVLGLDHEFDEGIGFSMEIDFEHAATEIELEYAFLHFDLTPDLTLRAGALLMPVGPLNEFHEPTLYYSVERPYVQRSLIPTTWQEVGLGVVGRALDGKLAYRAYVVNGLDASKFNTADGIRKGRGDGGAEAPAEDIAGVIRLEYPALPELTLGASVYGGGVDQRTAGLKDRPYLAIYEADALLTLWDFEVRGVFVTERLSQADDVSAAVGETIGGTMQGGYVEIAHHLLRLAAPDSSHDLVGFARYEGFDTSHDAPRGFKADPAADRQVLTCGLAYYPIRNIVIKADYERWHDGSGDRLGRWNLGLAFVY